MVASTAVDALLVVALIELRGLDAYVFVDVRQVGSGSFRNITFLLLLLPHVGKLLRRDRDGKSTATNGMGRLRSLGSHGPVKHEHL